MKETIARIVLLIVLLCVCECAAAEDKIIERGLGGIGEHLETLSKYKQDKSLSSQSPDRDGTERVAWKVGDGSLVLKATMGVGLIRDITYVVGDEHLKERKSLKVKAVDLAKGEMTACMPGYDQAGALEKEPNANIQTGHSIDVHRDTLNMRCGKGTPVGNTGTNSVSISEVMMWKVGDGYLEIETTLGAGIVKDITYVVGDENGEKRTRMKVKDVDLTKGEMTILVSGYSDRQSLGEETGNKK